MERRFDMQITTRVTRRDKGELEALAAAHSVEPLTLARTLLREGIRRGRHPTITFRTGAGGRRAAMEGHRLDVWQVMETVWSSNGDVAAAAGYLNLAPAQVRAAVAYCADYPEEVSALVERNHQEAERHQAQWRREHDALRR